MAITHHRSRRRVVGFAICIGQGYRFHATDSRLDELHSSIWPTVDDVRRLARGTLDAAPPARSVTPTLHGRARSSVSSDS